MPKLNVLSPVGAVRPVAATGLARRTGDLSGLRLGLLDNGKPSSNELLHRAAHLLAREFGTRLEVYRRKRNTSLPDDPYEIEVFAREIDIALVGTGD